MLFEDNPTIAEQTNAFWADVAANAENQVAWFSRLSSASTPRFSRVFRISSLHVAEMAVVPDAVTNEMRRKASNMSLAERADMRTDSSNFELDDDDVGDGVFSFYAHWVLHSYSD